MKEIQVNTNKWTIIINFVEMFRLSKELYRFSVISHNIPMKLFSKKWQKEALYFCRSTKYSKYPKLV